MRRAISVCESGNKMSASISFPEKISATSNCMEALQVPKGKCRYGPQKMYPAEPIRSTVVSPASAFGATNATNAWDNRLASATTNSAGWEVIHDNSHDTLTLSGVNRAALLSVQSDFKFV
jgi:hypothetical protein